MLAAASSTRKTDYDHYVRATSWSRWILIAIPLCIAPRVTSNSSGCGQSNSSTREAGQGTVSLSLFPGQELQR
ncbi:hypothetical protein, partial [Bradyrhizobium liaoningense]|uniref:hypothetical protein n=1 Tax=Bradyrhizobium liaoningense TaxID=43992 RepID=UPI0024E113A6